MGHSWLLLGAQLGYMPGGWTLDPGDAQVCWGLAPHCTPRQSAHGEGHRPLGHGDAAELLGLEAGPTPSRIHAQVTGPSSPAPWQWCCPDLLHGLPRLSGDRELPAPGRPQLQPCEPALFSSRRGSPHPVPAYLSASAAGNFQGKMKKLTAAFPGWVTGSSALHYSRCCKVSESDTPLRKRVFIVAVCAGTFSHRGSGPGRRTGGHPDPWTQAGLLEVPAGVAAAGAAAALYWGPVMGSGLDGS